MFDLPLPPPCLCGPLVNALPPSASPVDARSCQPAPLVDVPQQHTPLVGALLHRSQGAFLCHVLLPVVAPAPRWFLA